MGERTPNRADATGVLSGLRGDVGRQQLARAAVEGVVCGLLDGLDALSRVASTTDGRLVVVGADPGRRRTVEYSPTWLAAPCWYRTASSTWPPAPASKQPRC
jgi:hypothetical protein